MEHLTSHSSISHNFGHRRRGSLVCWGEWFGDRTSIIGVFLVEVAGHVLYGFVDKVVMSPVWSFWEKLHQFNFGSIHLITGVHHWKVCLRTALASSCLVKVLMSTALSSQANAKCAFLVRNVLVWTSLTLSISVDDWCFPIALAFHALWHIFRILDVLDWAIFTLDSVESLEWWATDLMTISIDVTEFKLATVVGYFVGEEANHYNEHDSEPTKCKYDEARFHLLWDRISGRFVSHWEGFWKIGRSFFWTGLHFLFCVLSLADVIKVAALHLYVALFSVALHFLQISCFKFKFELNQL